MKYDTEIVFLPQKEYLAIKGYMSWREISPDEHDEWKRKYGFPNKNMIPQLKAKAGSDKIYSLFCNSCRKDEQFDWVCGDDLACENINNAQAGDGFELVHLASSDYLKIIYHYGNEMTGEQAAKEADDYFWNEWLVNNPYESRIGGEFADNPKTADITLYDDENRCVVAWHPVTRTE